MFTCIFVIYFKYFSCCLFIMYSCMALAGIINLLESYSMDYKMVDFVICTLTHYFAIRYLAPLVNFWRCTFLLKTINVFY